MGQVTTAPWELRRRASEETGIVPFLRRLWRVRLASVGASIILAAIACAVLAPQLAAGRDPISQSMDALLEAPSLKHPFGTDELGRDVYARVLYGTRISLQVGLISVGIGMTVGVILGLIAGYFGGLLDNLIMRVIDAMLAFPMLVLALAITAALGANLRNAMIAIGIVGIPTYARLVRGQVLSVREREFVEAARALGAGHGRIMLLHILPNVTAPIIVQASLMIATAILSEASLSFLGLGVQPPTPSWGSMLNDGKNYLEMAPWMAIFPGMAIFLVVLGFNLLGDAVRDALDPRL